MVWTRPLRIASLSIVVASVGAYAQYRLNESADRDTPAPTKVVQGAYKSDGHSVEVVGVCKVTEESVACWTPAGDPKPDLEKRIKESLTKAIQGPVMIRYGKKNRLIVLKCEAPADSGDSISLEIVNGRSASSTTASGERSPDGRQIQWTTVNIPFEADEESATVGMVFLRSLTETSNVAPKKGEKFEFAGARFQITELEENQRPKDRTTFLEPQSWRLTVEPLEPEKEVRVKLECLVRGEVAPVADLKAVPMTQAEQKRMIEKSIEDRKKSKSASPVYGFPRTNPAIMGPMEIAPKKSAYKLFADPRKIGKFKVSGWEVEHIAFPNIRLDPK